MKRARSEGKIKSHRLRSGTFHLVFSVIWSFTFFKLVEMWLIIDVLPLYMYINSSVRITFVPLCSSSFYTTFWNPQRITLFQCILVCNAIEWIHRPLEFLWLHLLPLTALSHFCTCFWIRRYPHIIISYVIILQRIHRSLCYHWGEFNTVNSHFPRNATICVIWVGHFFSNINPRPVQGFYRIAVEGEIRY